MVPEVFGKGQPPPSSTPRRSLHAHRSCTTITYKRMTTLAVPYTLSSSGQDTKAIHVTEQASRQVTQVRHSHCKKDRFFVIVLLTILLVFVPVPHLSGGIKGRYLKVHDRVRKHSLLGEGNGGNVKKASEVLCLGETVQARPKG
jgi:hypothetical protein